MASVLGSRGWHRARDPDSDPRGVLGGWGAARGKERRGRHGLRDFHPYTLGEAM